jgi:hypothetical protein
VGRRRKAQPSAYLQRAIASAKRFYEDPIRRAEIKAAIDQGKQELPGVFRAQGFELRPRSGSYVRIGFVKSWMRGGGVVELIGRRWVAGVYRPERARLRERRRERYRILIELWAASPVGKRMLATAERKARREELMSATRGLEAALFNVASARKRLVAAKKAVRRG